MSWIVTS